MPWDGTERRKTTGEGEYCSQHIMFSDSIAVIKNSVQNIEKTMTEQAGFRRTIGATLAGILITIIIQVAVFSYFFGKLSKEVEVNTHRMEVVERKVFP